MILDSWTGMTWGRFVRNKPNLPIADCGRSRSGTGGSCKTNPISGLAGRRGGTRGKCAKQSQAWASWGIWCIWGWRVGEPIVRQRLVARCRSGNEANFGCRGRREPPLFQYSIIPAFPPVPVVRNKPNPSGGAGWEEAWGDVGRRANAQNEPNFRRCPGVRGVGAIVRNKPNWPPATPEPAGPIVRNKANCGGSFKSEVSSVELARPGGQVYRSSCFKLYTSSFPRVARWWGS
jgi:hypothetical protein